VKYKLEHFKPLNIIYIYTVGRTLRPMEGATSIAPSSILNIADICDPTRPFVDIEIECQGT